MTFRLKIDDELELRLLEERHADSIFAVIDRNRQHLREWLPWLDGSQSADDTRAFIKRVLTEFANGEAMHTGIWFQNRIVGAIGFNRIRSESRKAAIGYWLDAGHQGHGIITRACRAMTEHAFRELELNRVEIHCATGNTRSCAVPERLGYKLEGVLREAGWLYDHFIDLKIYGMLASEWPGTDE